MGGYMIEDWQDREGETPYDDLSGFRQKKEYPNPSRSVIDILEEDNIRQAVLYYLSTRPSRKKAPFNYEWFLKLHQQMFGKVWRWAGQEREQNTSIGVDKYLIRKTLKQLEYDLKYWEETFCPLDVVVHLHHRAVWIHPFKNGNGRWSRFLADIWLVQNGLYATEWPSIYEASPIREDYLQAVRKADGQDYEPLKKLYKTYNRSFKENKKPQEKPS